MALKLVCKDQKLPALPTGVARIIETFAQCEHHAAFTLKYGRVLCDPFPGMEYEIRTIPQLLPGFARFIWSVDYRELRPGMEIIFKHLYNYWGDLDYVACILKDVDDSGFTYVREGVEEFVTRRRVYAMFYLFVASPGRYMRFVGRDRYTGDLTDLLPLKEGEVMSQEERDIREFYEDRQDHSDDGEN